MAPDKHVRNVYYGDAIHCEVPLPNLNSANIFLCSVKDWGQTAKFKDHQYFWLYGIFPTLLPDLSCSSASSADQLFRHLRS